MISVGTGQDQVWAEVQGSGEGPPIVLLHPGVGVSTIWDDVVPGLAAGHRVVRFDKRGLGRSPAPTEPFEHAEDLRTVLDAVGAPTAHLVGNSMGGSAALDLATRSPDRVASLTLLCPGVSGWDWPDDPTGAAFAALAESGDVAGLVDLALRTWAGAGPEGPARDQVEAASAAWALEGEHEQPGEPAWPRLGELAVPTTVVIGELDHPPLVALDEALVGAIPGAVPVRLTGVDHLPSLRVPDVVVRTVLDTVARAEHAASQGQG